MDVIYYNIYDNLREQTLIKCRDGGIYSTLDSQSSARQPNRQAGSTVYGLAWWLLYRGYIMSSQKKKSQKQLEFNFINEVPPLCACGCENPVTKSKRSPNNWNAYIRGHALIIRWRDPKYRTKMSNASRERWQIKEHRDKAIQGMKDAWNTDRIENARIQMLDRWKNDDFSKMMGQKSKERWESPDCRKRMIEGIKVTKNSPEFHAKMQPLWNSPDYRSLKSKLAKQMWQSDPTVRERVSKASKERWQDPKHRAMMLEIRKEQGSRPEFIETMRWIAIQRWSIPGNRERLSEIMLTYWEDPDFVDKVLAGWNKSPNNFESEFDNATPIELRYVGSGDWWRKLPNGKYKNPDFKVTGQNKVVELFGNYWHQNDDPNELIEQYNILGIKCLVVWESDWKVNRKLVLEKVHEFIEKGAK